MQGNTQCICKMPLMGSGRAPSSLERALEGAVEIVDLVSERYSLESMGSVWDPVVWCLSKPNSFDELRD